MKILRLSFLLLSAVLCNTGASFAQDKETRWYNPVNEKSPLLHQQLWNGAAVENYYDRLPAKGKDLVRKEVWGLSKNAAGLKLVFNTNAQDITVRYVTSRSKNSYAMPHFPATGVSGVDLFAENADGSWAWAGGKYDFGDTISYVFSGLTLDKAKYANGRNYHLYLPLYNGVQWLEIGVAGNSTFKFIPPAPSEKPIIIYGTSIAQGGCASRAGMAWTNLLNRQLHMPVVNLGFSGNGRMEKEVVDMIVEHDARMFVFDCLPNMGGEREKIRPRIIDAVKAIRAKYPNTPILLVDEAHFTDNRLNESTSKGVLSINKLSSDTYRELKAQGVKGLYYLSHKDIGFDMNDAVDGSHPTDGGMLKYAKAYEKAIRSILKQ
ncbi:SGNH/GDSL hydrolase family protein [Chitinophaga lutea]